MKEESRANELDLDDVRDGWETDVSRGNGRSHSPRTANESFRAQLKETGALKQLVIPSNVDELKGTMLTPLATARRLREHHGNDLRHATGLGWLVWDGRRFHRSEKAAHRLAHNMGAAIREEFNTINNIDPEVAKAYYAHAKHVETSQGINGVLEIASKLEGIDADNIEWDSNPWLLNCPNGTVDLRTGKLLPHSRDDHITKLCPTNYNSQAKAPRWLQFLHEVFEGNQELIDYWQWVMGYAFTGVTDFDCFFVLHGEGANGKTTMLNTIQEVLGLDYAQQINSEELMAQRFSRHTTELAQLHGARIVVATETPEGRRLNEPLIKGLTGGDRIRARFMRKDSFEFVPVLKLFIGTNYKPSIRDDSTGMWRRVRLIPFEASFTGNQCDAQLQSKLSDEREGILAWVVHGAMSVAKGEPQIPDCVKAAIDTYRGEQDVISEFIESECLVGEGLTIEKAALFRAWQAWMGGRGGTQRSFNPRIKAKGFAEPRSNSAKKWEGITLISSDLQKYGDPR